jgi:hypothetical protein
MEASNSFEISFLGSGFQRGELEYTYGIWWKRMETPAYISPSGYIITPCRVFLHTFNIIASMQALDLHFLQAKHIETTYVY